MCSKIEKKIYTWQNINNTMSFPLDNVLTLITLMLLTTYRYFLLLSFCAWTYIFWCSVSDLFQLVCAPEDINNSTRDLSDIWKHFGHNHFFHICHALYVVSISAALKCTVNVLKSLKCMNHCQRLKIVV